MMRFSVLMLILGYAFASCESAQASWISDGSFETQGAAQSPVYKLGPNGEQWGRDWIGGWDEAGLASSWRAQSVGAWTGGSICRTEDFASGWKWAQQGVVFGLIQGNQTMSQKFTPNASGSGILEWFDSNRNSWRGDTWFGRESDYKVTITHVLSGETLFDSHPIYKLTSKVKGGSESNSLTNQGDGRFDLANRKGWDYRSLTFDGLIKDEEYKVNFIGLNGPDDRTTLLDNIHLNGGSISQVPEPSTLAIFGLGSLGLAFLRRRRTSLS
jgi:hypothetical protein